MDKKSFLEIPESFEKFFDNLESIPVSKCKQDFFRASILISFMYGKLSSIETEPLQESMYYDLKSKIVGFLSSLNTETHETYINGLDVIKFFLIKKEISAFLGYVREYLEDRGEISAFQSWQHDVTPLLESIIFVRKQDMGLRTIQNILGD